MVRLAEYGISIVQTECELLKKELHIICTVEDVKRNEWLMSVKGLKVEGN